MKLYGLFNETLDEESVMAEGPARDSKMLDQITGMGPERSKSLYALAEKLLGDSRS